MRVFQLQHVLTSTRPVTADWRWAARSAMTGAVTLYRHFTNLDNLLTVRRSITLVDFQLDAQNSYLFTYNIFINTLRTDDADLRF